jgi:hypothetical protein
MGKIVPKKRKDFGIPLLNAIYFENFPKICLQERVI